MKFREHRGGLNESLATCVEVSSLDDLVKHCQKLLAPYCFNFDAAQLTIRPYRYDARIGWDTHIVMIEGYGPIGFTDGPL